MSIIVHVEQSGTGYRAAARQGVNEYEASATSPELAARLASAQLAARPVTDVRAEPVQPGVWRATVKGGAS